MSGKTFICRRCGKPFAVIKALIKGYIVVIIGKCASQHTNKLFLQYREKDSWLAELKDCIFHCSCGEKLKNKNALLRGHYYIVMLNCPIHGSVKRYISYPIWNELEKLSITRPPSYKTDIPSRDYGPKVIIPPVNPPEVINSPIIDERGWNTNILQSQEINKERSGNIKFCPSCGEEITPGSFFCTNCGEEIK